jgi:hypothetical protein
MDPADLHHNFNIFTISFKMKYLKLNIKVISAYNNVKRPKYETSG